MNPAEIVNQYVSDLSRALAAIDLEEVQEVIRALDVARTERARIFVVGNGGSAATASHLCADLSVGLKRRGLIGFDIQSLTDNASISTAVANDVDFDDIFTAQLEGVIGPNDVLLAISASGNSPNILNAVSTAKAVGATVIGCSGFDGGELKKLADISFHVPTRRGAYGIVEDIHLVLNHILHIYFVASAQTSEQHPAADSISSLERVPASGSRRSGWVQLEKSKGRRRWQTTPNSLT